MAPLSAGATAAARLAAASSRRLPGLRARGRVALALHHRLAARTSGVFTVPMRRGHVMEAPMGSTQSWRAAFTGAYDEAEIELLLPYVARGTLVLDIGASLGFYTVPLAAAARGAGGHVVAVEPLPANCEVVRRNVALNGLDDTVSVLPVALGRASGEVAMHVEPGGRGNAAVVSDLPAGEIARHDPAGRAVPAEAIPVRRLDDLDLPGPAAGRRCSLVKIDVEGFEAHVLAGGAGFVAAHRPAILAEFHPEWLRSRGAEPEAAQRWAGESGYRCFELVYHRPRRLLDVQRISLRPLPEAGARSGTSVLLVPADSPSA